MTTIPARGGRRRGDLMPPRLSTFNEVLAAAVDDLLANGFDSMERVARWTRELRLAAERSLVSATSLEQQLRDGLVKVYRKMVEQGDVVRYNPGVERYTLEKVKPALRSELDRRIMASADLIKLNRNEAIDATLRRFQGWSTSIPPGGVSAERKPAVKKAVRKSLSSLPFEERRVLIDQGHKLIAAINDVVASDGGAIAGRWRSNWRQPGYDYREDHKERDGKVYLIRDSWAHRGGLVKQGKAGYVDQSTAPAQEPFCRCYYIYLYNLSDLPEDMLTAKGKEALRVARGREEVYSARTARGDSAQPEGFDTETLRYMEALRLDIMGYLRGLVSVRLLPDDKAWHAQYDDRTDEVLLYPAFERLGARDRVHVFLHEAGHRAQRVDPQTFAMFRDLHGDRLEQFLSMANLVHLQDYERTGKVDGGLADEVFAESYARFALEADMPEELREFWRRRLEAGPMSDTRITQAAASYAPVWPNLLSRCQRCSMFVRVCGGSQGNACRSVDGRISAHGHCKLFEIDGARSDSAEAETLPAVGTEALRRRIERLKTAIATETT
jgi:hypothetical protein